MIPRRFTYVVLALAAFACARPAAAEPCGPGSGRTCGCGDIVVANTVLDADIGVCDETALRVASGVTLDCAGHTITGSDLSNAKFGIQLDGVEGATVKNCRVTKFRRGLRINGGKNNVLLKNKSWENKYGIDVADTTGNLIKGNGVHANRDEGVHLGEAHDNRIIGNRIARNKRENLYLLRSHGNDVERNLMHHGGHSAIYIKHSSDNHFFHNTARDTAVQLRGDAHGNTFDTNYLKGDGYLLEAYEEPAPTGWTFPHDNTMTNDCIRKTDFCYRFVGAFDNAATAARTDGRCDPPMTETSEGGRDATGNSVELAPQGCNVDPF
ncbi:MAG TPA: right-handed parallel beta-helix repeat-containing protein [Candidatus Binatia bacterium]|nr:right-handed parallel beta-helix repeat-containing protein [Candidatus Binatia bacterium]